MRIRTLAIAAILMAGPAVPATADTCQDGVDCLCDTLSSPGVVYCEDFENPGYNVPGPLGPNHAWAVQYGSGDGGSCEGNSPGCVLDIVTANACGAAGENDCVFDGRQTMGQRHEPGSVGGTAGEMVAGAATMGGPHRTIGITMAWKYSENMNGSLRSGRKQDRFEEVGGNFEIFGENASLSEYWECTGAQAPNGSVFPFAAPIDVKTGGLCGGAPFKSGVCSPNVVVHRGRFCENDVHYHWGPSSADYEWGQSARPGEWMCVQAHFQNVGRQGMRVRYWLNGSNVIDMENINGSVLRGELADGFSNFRFVNYWNNGYDGSSVAARYEDNIVITTADEPVPCSAIGFDFDSEGSLSRPAPPTGPEDEEPPAPPPASGGSGVGIASLYPGDDGIESHPSVFFAADFENSSAGAAAGQWTDALNTAGMSLSGDVPAMSSGSSSLRMTAVGGSTTGGHVFRRIPEGSSTVHLRYYVKYGAGSGFRHTGGRIGGYNPPTNWPQGGAGQLPSGDDKFSVAFEPAGGASRMDFYNYWAGMRQSGDGNYWGNHLLNDGSIGVPNQWTCVEFRVKMNDPVSAPGGELTLWIEDEEAAHYAPGTPTGSWSGGNFFPGGGAPFEGFLWRTSPALSPNWVQLSHYAPDAAPGQSLAVSFDDVVIATERIGCIDDGTADGPGLSAPGRPVIVR